MGKAGSNIPVYGFRNLWLHYSREETEVKKATINFSILPLIRLRVGTAQNYLQFFNCIKNKKYDGQILHTFSTTVLNDL